MVTMPSPPAWKKDAKCDERGWRHPRTNELLVARGFTAEEVAMYNAAQVEEVAAAAAPAPQVLVEVPVHVEESAPEEPPIVLTEVVPPPVDLESMTKREIEAHGRTVGIELDRRNSKAKMIAELNEHTG